MHRKQGFLSLKAVKLVHTYSHTKLKNSFYFCNGTLMNMFGTVTTCLREKVLASSLLTASPQGSTKCALLYVLLRWCIPCRISYTCKRTIILLHISLWKYWMIALTALLCQNKPCIFDFWHTNWMFCCAPLIWPCTSDISWIQWLFGVVSVVYCTETESTLEKSSTIFSLRKHYMHLNLSPGHGV